MTYTQLTPPPPLLPPPPTHPRLPKIALAIALTDLLLAIFFVVGLFGLRISSTGTDIGGMILGVLLIFVLLPIIAVVATLSFILSLIAFPRHRGSKTALLAFILSLPLAITAIYFILEIHFSR